MAIRDITFGVQRNLLEPSRYGNTNIVVLMSGSPIAVNWRKKARGHSRCLEKKGQGHCRCHLW